MSERREDYLLRTSEIYRRLRSRAVPHPAPQPVELPKDAGPPDTVRALPRTDLPQVPPPGPHFVRRMLTRRLDIREIILLAVVAAALFASRR